MDSMTNEQKKVFDYIIDETDTAKKVIIQGSAGTGKSYLIKHVREYLAEKESNIVTTSHTALSSSLINGPTLYKLFKFNIQRTCGSVIIGKYKYSCIKKGDEKRFNFNNKYRIGNSSYTPHVFDKDPLKNYIVIDEISMIGLEFLDDIESLLRCCFNKDKLFGGVNIILVGDMYQLPPVKDISIINAHPGHFIYSFKCFELSVNKRQENTEFAELCNAFRTGILSSAQKKMLMDRRIENFPKVDYKNLLHIYPTRLLCHKHNMEMLNNIESVNTFYFVLSEDIIPNMRDLPLKQHETFQGLPSRFVVTENSKVMVTRNINDKLFNGCIDIIDDISFLNEHLDSDIRKEFYKNIPNIDIDEYQRIEKLMIDKGYEVVFCKPSDLTIHLSRNNVFCEPMVTSLEDSGVLFFQRRMFPFQMTWAVTTHKIQGVTLDEGVIDLSENNFDPTQLYVNISRLRSIDSLYITSLSLPLKRNPLRKRIKEFFNNVSKD